MILDCIINGGGDEEYECEDTYPLDRKIRMSVGDCGTFSLSHTLRKVEEEPRKVREVEANVVVGPHYFASLTGKICIGTICSVGV